MASNSTPTVPFFKKKGKRANASAAARQKLPDQDADGPHGAESELMGSEVVRPSNPKKRTLAQRLADEQRAQEPPEIDGDRVGVNWQKSTGGHNDAREILDGEEAEALVEERKKKARLARGEDLKDAVDDGSGLYKGSNAYQHKLGRKDETMLPKAQRIGPVKSNSTIRTVTMIDYQPDVCKDYKETGYCGFGDTCKFLHDRGTYLQGWQLDKISNKSNFKVFATRAGLEKPVSDSEGSDSDDEDIPFACIICRKPYTMPIVTRCGHYFCQQCAIKRYTKNPRCAACGTATNGLFNSAEKQVEKSMKKRLKEARDAGVGDDDREVVEVDGIPNDD